MVAAILLICSITSRLGERFINSLNAGRNSRHPLKAMTNAANNAAQLSAFS